MTYKHRDSYNPRFHVPTLQWLSEKRCKPNVLTVKPHLIFIYGLYTIFCSLHYPHLVLARFTCGVFPLLLPILRSYSNAPVHLMYNGVNAFPIQAPWPVLCEHQIRSS